MSRAKFSRKLMSVATAKTYRCSRIYIQMNKFFMGFRDILQKGTIKAEKRNSLPILHFSRKLMSLDTAKIY